MLISCCEIFAPKPVSHSHTAAQKDTLPFFKRISFIYLFLPLYLAVLPVFLETVSNKTDTAKYLSPLMIRRREVV